VKPFFHMSQIMMSSVTAGEPHLGRRRASGFVSPFWLVARATSPKHSKRKPTCSRVTLAPTAGDVVTFVARGGRLERVVVELQVDRRRRSLLPGVRQMANRPVRHARRGDPARAGGRRERKERGDGLVVDPSVFGFSAMDAMPSR